MTSYKSDTRYIVLSRAECSHLGNSWLKKTTHNQIAQGKSQAKPHSDFLLCKEGFQWLSVPFLLVAPLSFCISPNWALEGLDSRSNSPRKVCSWSLLDKCIGVRLGSFPLQSRAFPHCSEDTAKAKRPASSSKSLQVNQPTSSAMHLLHHWETLTGIQRLHEAQSNSS